MGIYKKIIISTFSVAVILVALYYSILASIPFLIDLNKYKENIFSSIEKETGYKVTSENISFKRSLKPFLKIHLYHTAIMYPNNEVFLQIKDSDLEIKLLPLLLKQIVIKDAKFSRPIINITLYKDFTTSLEKYSVDKQIINTNGYKFHSIANESIFKNYKIKFKDDSINKTFYLEGDELYLADILPDSSAHILMKGSLFENKKEYIKYDIDIQSVIPKREHSFTYSPFKTIMESNINANITGHLKIDKDNNINGNLKVENLSLKLNDIVSSNNNASIIFNGKEAGVDAILHTSKSDIAEVKGKYAFGRKRYIDLNTNAKNVNLDNLFKIVSSVSKILNVQNPLNDVQATGTLNAVFSLNSDFKNLKSSGSAQITNAIINHKELPYPIKNINANINFANNSIKIEKAEANINNTPITLEGNIENNLTVDLKAYSDNLDLKTVSVAFINPNDIPFTVQKGNLNFNSEITGNVGKKIKTVSDVHISNGSFVDKKSKIPFYTNKININLSTDDTKYVGDINIETLNTEINKQKINADKFNITFDEKNIVIPENNITVLSSPFKIKGNVQQYAKEPIINIDFDGKLNSLNLAKLLSQYVNMPYKANGNIHTVGKYYFEKGKQLVKANLNADKTNYISYMVIKEILNKPSLLNIDCEIQNNYININNMTLYDGNTPSNDSSKKLIAVNGGINIENDIEFKDIKILIPNVISGKTNFLGGEDISLKSDITLNKNIKSPEIKGNIKVNQYNIKKYLTAIKNADISFNNDNIRLIAPDVQVNDSFFNITADIVPSFNTNDITIKNMQLNSINLDLNSLFPILYDNREIFAKSNLNIKHGVATVNNFNVLDIKAKDISSDFQVEKNIVKLYNIMANAYSGIVEGKANYDLYSGMLNLDISGKNIDIKNSIYDLCKLEDNLSGRTDFKAVVSMMTGNYSSVIKSLNGTLDFKAQNGGMGTLGKFEYYLSAKNILYHGLLNATINRIAEALKHDKTEQYKTARGKIIFQNAYIITDDIQTVGTKMSLYVKGRHNLLTNQSNIDIYGRVSDDITKKMGSAGDISLSEIISGQSSRKDIVLSNVQKSITDKIPDLYNSSSMSNTFKVNILGDIKAVNSINSFEWIAPYDDGNEINETLPEKQQENNETLPDFSDIMPDM